MSTEILLWLLPGYLVCLFHRRVSPHRNSSGWDFIALVGLYSAIVFVVVHILQKLFTITPFVSSLHSGLYKEILSLPIEKGFGLLPLAMVVAIVYGVIICSLKSAEEFAWEMSRLDPMSVFMRCAINALSPVIISMKNGKVYVGIVQQATFDRNEITKFCSVALLFSGYRKSENHHVVLDKRYKSTDDGYDITTDNNVKMEIILPYSEIFSVAHFSEQLTEKFVNEGTASFGSASKVVIEEAGKTAEHTQPPDASVVEFGKASSSH
jgi:hypothetical protein